jgi:hypothetical protein
VVIPTARAQDCDIVEEFNGSSPEEKKGLQYHRKRFGSSDVLIGRSIWEYLLRCEENSSGETAPFHCQGSTANHSTVDGQHARTKIQVPVDPLAEQLIWESNQRNSDG